ncbi:putative 2-aminoethylphosphonate ABC transporter permease subunit [Clostridium cadaveris]|uniref:putative 2-aminoethylphosphonate ABC transporter permease subunit n=1 Tax=Clostridium cadaveris TaxID=1529 RepID=UPI000C07ADDD|nr:putative 2-aminoethylphosphonate ABC transporter permease subunit [Clostridium cadaveris]
MKKINKSDSTRISLIIIIISFLMVTLLFPIVNLFKEAFYNEGAFIGFANFSEYLKTPALVSSIKHSFTIALISTAIVIVLAFLYAYALERTNVKGKGFLKWIALLPLFAPTMTHGIALIYLFGAQGIITTGFFGKLSSLAFEFPLYGMWGIIFAESIYIFPSIFMMFRVALKLTDNRLYEAAEVMGTTKVKQFFTITIPSVKYTMVSAFFGAFTMAFTDFGAPKVVGGSYNLLATDIYKQVIGQQNITMGATVGILLLIPSVIAFIVDQRLNKKNSTVDSKAVEYVTKKDKKRDIIFGSFTYIIALIIIMIFGTIIFAAFVKQWPYDLSFTLDWFKVKTYGISTFEIYYNTIYTALMSAIIGTVLVLITSYLTNRGRGFGKMKKALSFLCTMPLALPGLVVGLSYILFFNKANNPLNGIYGTITIIVLANIIHFLSVPYMTITTSMKKIDMEYENVSESMGVPWYKVLSNVIIPMSMPSILESFSYYFVNSMMTISAVIFLYAFDTKLAAIDMINKYDIGEVAAAAAMAVLIIFTNIIFKAIFDKIIEKMNK